MEKTQLEKLIDFLEENKDHVGLLVGIVMKLPNQPKPELQVNYTQSLQNKINYFKAAYNPDLTLKANPEVKVLRWGWDVLLEGLEDLLVEER